MEPRDDAALRSRLRRQEALLDLSEAALGTADVDDLLAEAATTLADALDADVVTVLERERRGDLLLRHGHGLPAHLAGRAAVPPARDTLAAVALRAPEPLTVADLRSERAPEPCDFVVGRDVRAGVGGSIETEDDAWGALVAYADEERAFDAADAAFLGRVANLLSTAIEERRTRAELEQDSRTLDELLTHLPLSIYVKDDQHRHERVSDAMICAEDPDLYLENDEGKAHQHPDDLLGKTDFDIFGPELEEAIEDDREVMETGEPIVDQIERSETRLGDEAWYSTTKAPRYDEDGEVAGVLGVTLDVTDRMRYRRDLEQTNERLEEFASMLSHDLRNPLTVAQGYLEELAEDRDEVAVRHASEALDRIEELIEEILTFARQGQAVVDPDVVDLERVARDAWNAVDTREATLTVDAELPVRADPARLQRVLENLFRNAVEHGGPAVRVRLADRDTDFFVEDDGPGVPADRRESVFDRGVTTAEDGTGFGLATVRAVAGAHGWDVHLEEGSDGGARFVFTGVVRSDAH